MLTKLRETYPDAPMWQLKEAIVADDFPWSDILGFAESGAKTLLPGSFGPAIDFVSKYLRNKIDTVKPGKIT